MTGERSEANSRVELASSVLFCREGGLDWFTRETVKVVKQVRNIEIVVKEIGKTDRDSGEASKKYRDSG